MKFVSKKRIASTVLAGAMAMAMAVPAFAADPEPNTTVLTGTYKPIILAVTVPTTGNVIINPYGLPVELDEETVISGEQITNGAPLLISNQSKVALAVGASVIGEVKGTGVAFSDTDASNETDKKINAVFQAFKAPGVTADTEPEELNAMFAELKSDDAVLTATVKATSEEATGDLVLREGDEEGLTQDGGAAFFRLSGTVSKKPTTAWADTDGFTTTVAFTFEPGEYVGAVTLALDGGATQVEVGGTVTVSAQLPAGVKVAKGTTPIWTQNGTSATNTYLSVAADPSSTDTKLVGKVTGVKKGTAGTVSLEFEGSDGVTYRSAPLTIKVVDPT